jgi:hypothetical protein
MTHRHYITQLRWKRDKRNEDLLQKPGKVEFCEDWVSSNILNRSITQQKQVKDHSNQLKKID